MELVCARKYIEWFRENVRVTNETFFARVYDHVSIFKLLDFRSRFICRCCGYIHFILDAFNLTVEVLLFSNDVIKGQILMKYILSPYLETLTCNDEHIESLNLSMVTKSEK